MKENPAHYQGKPGMIISCPNCETHFRIDDSRIGPQGKKVRCSKCGYVWRVAPDGRSAADEAAGTQPEPQSEAERPNPSAPPGTDEAAEVTPPSLAGEGSTGPSDEAPISNEPEPEEAGADGLTGEQRAKLAEARRKKPRSRFWIKVLLIFVIVAGLLLLARNMMTRQEVGMRAPAPANSAADVGAVDAKPAPNKSMQN